MMRSGRLLAVALLAIGLGLGALTPIPMPRPVPLADGYLLLAGDFHVHAVPGDGALTPARLQVEAARRGLDVIAITNHNQMHAARLMQPGAPGDLAPLVLPGVEITNPGYHLIAIGITHVVDWSQSAAAVIDAVHAQGGVAIAAHPTRRYADGWDAQAIARLDGVEVAHPIRSESIAGERELDLFFNRVVRANADVAPIGSSDFHINDQPGRSRTFVFARERSVEGVLEAIRGGRTVAEERDGRLFGDPALVRIVEGKRPPRRAEEPSWLGLLSAVCVWLGTAGMLLLGTSGGTQDPRTLRC